MIQYEKDANDILSLFSYQSSQYFMKSLLFRKQAEIDMIDDSAIITWGPSLIIGGKFSDVISETLKTKLRNSENSRYIYYPEGEWKSYVENTFSDNLTERQINLYQHNQLIEINCQAELQGIVQITDEWFQRDLPNAQLIKDELYSYLTIEDFLQNGFGLALVIDDKVCGYCLSEYSIDNECAINIWIDEKYRGLGYAKTMTNLFLKHSKNKNWNVFWGCSSENIPSNKTAQSTGFALHSKQNYFEWGKG